MERLDRIKELLKGVTREHFKKLESECYADKIYGYSLYSSDDATSVGPVANTIGLFNKDKSDPMYNYYRYSVDEWKLWDDFGLYTEVNNLLRELVEDESIVIDFCELRDRVFSVFLEVLSELKNESVFQTMGADSFVVAWISDSDSDIMRGSAQLLNSELVFEEYIKEFGQYAF